MHSTKANATEWAQAAMAMESAAQDLAVATQLGAGSEFSWDTFRKGIIAGFVLAVILSILVVVIVVKAR